MKIHIAIIIMGFCFSLSPRANANESPDPIIISEPTPQEKSKDNTFPIIGFRPASNLFLNNKLIQGNGNFSSNDFFVSENIILKSWLTDNNFVQKISSLGIKKSDLTINELRKAGMNFSNFKWENIENDYKSVRRIGVGIDINSGELKTVDPNGVIGLTSLNIFDFSNRRKILIGDNNSYAIKVNYNNYNILNAYKKAKALSGSQISNPKVEWTTAIEQLKNKQYYNPIAMKTVAVQLGEATFGKLRIRNADEVGFQVDRRIENEYDIYLIEFTVTFYSVPKNVVAALSFRVDCSDVCIAWELAPIRIQSKSESTSTPSNPKTRNVVVGEFFQKSIIYENLNPEIVAYGLRESKFLWVLKGEAISAGSHTFVAAIGLPKGTKSFELERSVAMKTKRKILVEGGWASTSSKSQSVSLKP